MYMSRKVEVMRAFTILTCFLLSTKISATDIDIQQDPFRVSDVFTAFVDHIGNILSLRNNHKERGAQRRRQFTMERIQNE